MTLSFKDYLAETQMSHAELMKKANSGDFSGEWRLQIIKKMITGKEPTQFELENGDKITVDPHASIVKKMLALIPDDNDENVSGDEEKIVKDFFSKEAPFVDVETGRAYKLKDIKKSNAFGGGSKGSGGGAADTEKNESLQCVVCAIAFNKGHAIDEDDLTVENIDDVEDDFDISYSYSKTQDLLDDITKNSQWQTCYISTANVLLEKHGGESKSGYKFHRQSKWVKDLYDLAKKLNKQEDGPFKDLNKWNPSDIWMVKTSHSHIPTADTKSLVELNTWLYDKFKAKEVVGISLKKTSNAKYEEKNTDNDANELGDVEVLEFSIADKKNQIFIAKNAYIYFDEDQMQVKSKQQGYSAIQGELIGKEAKHGAISLGPINFILDRLSLSKVKTVDQIKSMIDYNIKNDKAKKYDKLLDSLIDNVVSCGIGINASDAKAQFLSSDKTSSEPWVVSKYQAVELISILKQTTLKKRKEFVFHAFAYAASKSELSSVFVKIS